MKPDDYRALLKRNDSGSSATFPPGFNSEQAILTARQLVQRLESGLGRPLSLVADFPIHDASFHAEVNLPGNGKDESWVTVRLSNFGSLATIINYQTMPAEALSLVAQALKALDYVYVPVDVLTEAYPRNTPGITTWMTRFFGYL